MSFEIIDFHMHPFLNPNDNLCFYKDLVDINEDSAYEEMKKSGISRFCGSIIKTNVTSFDVLKMSNREALYLREKYNGAYIPGFQISPQFVEESIKEIDFAYENGIKLIGELVPYMHNWEDYSCDEFSEILSHIRKYNMVVSLHTIQKNHDGMQLMAKRHPDIKFVFAHPGEKPTVMKHIEIMKNCDNVFLDISGTGILRWGMVKKLVSEVGAERILFGTDFPIGNPDAYIHGVLRERLTDREKELILIGNAKRILGI